MSKKFLTIVSMIIVLTTLLTACGGAATTAPAAPTKAAATDATKAPPMEATKAPVGAKATLKVLVHQNPPMVEFMTSFNEKFQAKYPEITVDMSVVNANDLSTVTQTRLAANDVDVVDMFGFANASQPYMKNVTPPNWQTLIEAGLLMDLTDQPFVKNYDAAAIKLSVR